jgi:hypothetical protein
MKVMAGYDNQHKTDYRAKAAEEVAKVQQKAKLLEDMLQNHKPGDKVGEGDVYEVREQYLGLALLLRELILERNLQMPCKAPIQKYRKCVKRNPMIQKL